MRRFMRRTPRSVKIENFAFTPQTLTVKVGTTVTFENDDDIPHQVVATRCRVPLQGA